MSVKYQRVKQADLTLPTPLRWLTRAFSSITLAVCLLTCVALYGLIGSVPVGYLATGGLYALVAVVSLAPVVLILFELGRRGRFKGSASTAVIATASLLLVSVALSYLGWTAVGQWAGQHPWITRHRATVVYRLPYLEMTELEFYSWWPFKVILGLFVINMIWATIRRIEFKFVNIGVLTVHTGIVLIAAGSIFYGSHKIEGDTLLWRSDLGGQPVDHFYDQTTPAIFFSVAGRQLMLSLHDLPRYNDYPADGGQFRIDLQDNPTFQEFFASLGVPLRATIPGFISYGSLEPDWIDAGDGSAPQVTPDRPTPDFNPALRLGFGNAETPVDGLDKVLVARWPGGRVIDEPNWALEYLVGPSPQRISDLMSRFEGPHGLVVEVAGTDFKHTYSIQQGDEITLGDTGYTLEIEAIGPYGMRFASRGYEDASDTRATVAVSRHGELLFRRIVLHRFPERSQDFVPAPGDPSVGPMGRRTDPDPALRLAYIDASKPQYRILSDARDLTALAALARLPDRDPMLTELTSDRLPVTDNRGRHMWVHILERMKRATRTTRPVITPKAQRDPKDEGTYIHALLPLDLEVDLPSTAAGPATTWRRRLWLPHMRYPDVPQQDYHPVSVVVPTSPPPDQEATGQSPGGMPMRVTFSRLRRQLPFAVSLAGFEMVPYSGTNIPRDFLADLSITEPSPETQGDPVVTSGRARLNNPLIHHGIKLSQTGWDPGDRNDPNHQARDAQGRFINQQRYSILGVGNNRGIRVIFIGACLVVAGIPWAFYVKPMLLRRHKRRIQARLARESPQPNQQAA